MAKKKAAKKAAPKKAASKKKAAVSLNTLYNEVARKADTQGLQIGSAETRRVLSCFFDALEDCSPAEAFDYIAKGLKNSGNRRR